MQIKPNRQTLLSVLIIISLSIPTFSQEQINPLQEKPVAEVTYTVTEVPKKIEEVTVYLNNLETTILPASEIVKMETTYVDFFSLPHSLDRFLSNLRCINLQMLSFISIKSIAPPVFYI